MVGGAQARPPPSGAVVGRDPLVDLWLWERGESGGSWASSWRLSPRETVSFSYIALAVAASYIIPSEARPAARGDARVIRGCFSLSGRTFPKTGQVCVVHYVGECSGALGPGSVMRVGSAIVHVSPPRAVCMPAFGGFCMQASQERRGGGGGDKAQDKTARSS